MAIIEEKKNPPRLVVAACGSGSGKTLFTCALLNSLKKREKKVYAYKCGPDYIDPMFHKRVIGIPSRNLDLFFTDEDTTRSLFLKGIAEDGQSIAVVEGVMGLYDGVGGTTQQASAYHLAQTLKAPIILIVQAKGMGRSILAQIAGFLMMDTDKLIKGIVLNQISESYFYTLKSMIEEELDIPVLGFLPTIKDVNLESRHLGLKLPDEVENLHRMVDKASEVLDKYVDLDWLIKIASETDYLICKNCDEEYTAEAKVKIGVARDQAFCFYYDDNLDLLSQKGAELIPFSPLNDRELPKDISGIILGGGYPELAAKQLSENKSMLDSIRKAIEGGMPSIAECGGFMYLHEKIVTKEGEAYSLSGVVKGQTHYTGKLVRFGYVDIEDKTNKWLKKQGRIKGHEFHYYDSDNNGDDCVATKPVSNRSWECGHLGDNHWWGYGHLYYHSNPEFVTNFINKCFEFSKR